MINKFDFIFDIISDKNNFCFVNLSKNKKNNSLQQTAFEMKPGVLVTFISSKSKKHVYLKNQEDSDLLACTVLEALDFRDSQFFKKGNLYATTTRYKKRLRLV